MTISLFMLLCSGGCAGYLWWGFRCLPAERWQIAAAVPVAKDAAGHWHGLNLTWYGILTANAYVVATALALILMGSVGLSLTQIGVLVAVMLLTCVPASRLVAGLVEGKNNTFTVGGAVFVGTLIAPWLAIGASLLIRKQTGLIVQASAITAVFAIAYAFGEGLGRLACLSFGCCYGKPLATAHPILVRLFSRFSPAFSGATKKASYAGDLEGIRVLPVQGLSALVCVFSGLAGLLLFLHGHFQAAFLGVLTITQIWRVVVEFLREDFRGGGKFSVYQIMGIIGAIYGWVVTPLLSEPFQKLPDLGTGISMIWGAGPLLLLQGIWFSIFWYTGRSRVTGAVVTFHVNHGEI